ncbi:hypothetical protein BT93_A2316 [Corymbia citriodora subsp. variegata]|nr:hypothetical protein BT93_A2316 [Corymbia citriodora subsp. variegata]
MSNLLNDPMFQKETTCGTLLYELQVIWEEIGESDADRDKMLQELEQECLEVYRRKVDKSNQSRARLRQAIADAEAELATICSALGERPLHTKQLDQNVGSLKEEFKKILPQLEEMRRMKCERRNQFLDVLEQIQRVKTEIYGSFNHPPSKTRLDETDLSSRKLEELHRELYELQKEKTERLRLVQDHLFTVNALCLVLDLDFKQIVSEVHASLADPEGPKDISDITIEKLATAIHKLREVKLQRMQRLQDLATSMLELWNLMDTPIEEQQMFQNITSNIAASEQEITEPKMLSEDIINFVAAEVARLEEFKLSKMKELVLKKRSELEEICRKTHLIPEADTGMEYAIEAVESGAVDAGCILEQIELRIAEVKEEALNRKELLEKVEKWLAACDEECWLEEYNRDENRYNAGRGAHLTLKRAEKARSLVNKLPAMVETLTSKTVAWEKERGIEFSYDGIRLLSMLEEYTILREEREQERRRLRDQKKLQGQLIAEQEALYGSKPSPSKTQLVKKAPRMSTGGASSRRLSLGGATLHTPKPDPLHSMKATPNARPLRKSDRVNQVDLLNLKDNGQAALSASRRGLDVAGLPVKKHSLDAVLASEPDSPMIRKPFSPVSPAVSAKMSSTNVMDSAVARQDEPLQKIFSGNNNVFSTPLKTTNRNDEENWTPKVMAIPVPTTPSTISIPMQTAITPAVVSVPLGANLVKEIAEEIEYSFEERRAGFVLPRANIKPMIQV